MALENVDVNYFMLSKNGRKHTKYHFENPYHNFLKKAKRCIMESRCASGIGF